MSALFEARAVTKRFGGLTAVHGVDFSLKEGIASTYQWLDRELARGRAPRGLTMEQIEPRWGDETVSG